MRKLEKEKDEIMMFRNETAEDIKMKRLVVGEKYYIQTQNLSVKSEWTKQEFVGETGYENSLLRFKRKVKNRGNNLMFFFECFNKVDYFQNRLKILTKEMYREKMHDEIWDKVDEMLKKQKEA